MENARKAALAPQKAIADVVKLSAEVAVLKGQIRALNAVVQALIELIPDDKRAMFNEDAIKRYNGGINKNVEG